MTKGVSRNYNTKPNEKMHGPLKKSYVRQTNFKNIASQVWTFIHRILSRTLRFAFIFEVVIIRCDEMAHDRGIVHMITTHANVI